MTGFVTTHKNRKATYRCNHNQLHGTRSCRRSLKSLKQSRNRFLLHKPVAHDRADCGLLMYPSLLPHYSKPNPWKLSSATDYMEGERQGSCRPSRQHHVRRACLCRQIIHKVPPSPCDPPDTCDHRSGPSRSQKAE